MSIHAVHTLEDAAREDAGLMELAHALNGNIKQRFNDHAAFRQCTSAVVDRAKRQLITRTALKRIEVVVHSLNGLIAFFGGHINGVFIRFISHLIDFCINGTVGVKVVISWSWLFLNIHKAIFEMLPEALAHIWNHCPIQMGCAHATKLLEALKLEDDSHKLKRRVDTLCGANICLARVEAVGEKVIKRNRETVASHDASIKRERVGLRLFHAPCFIVGVWLFNDIRNQPSAVRTVRRRERHLI